MRKFHDPTPKPRPRNMTANLDNKIPVRIDERTTIFIKVGEDPEQAKTRYLERHEIAVVKRYGI